MRNWILSFFLFALLPLSAGAQRLLSLDSCRAMALRNNKQMGISRLKQDIAKDVRKSARTKYLPRINAMGACEYTSKEVSILNNDQKQALSTLGTTSTAGWKDELNNVAAGLAEDPQKMQALQQILQPLGLSPQGLIQEADGSIDNAAALIDAKGQGIVDAFRTDTRNIWTGAVMLTQPVFMGGSLIAMNRLADIGEELMANSADARRQQIIYNIDQAYWQVVSLKYKQQLAESFLELVKKLDSDVQKMIAEGVATRSDGLSVSVKVNEAEMTLSKVNDGLVLSKMLLCQLCGLPLDEQITLADEKPAPYPSSGDGGLETTSVDHNGAPSNLTPISLGGEGGASRPELRMLQNTVDMSRQTTNILKAGYLPTVALMGGYLISNPNAFNGWEKKFAGVWNVGLMIRIPVWNWGDTMYKVRASKSATAIASLELEEAKEKIELQVNQSSFKVTEAQKRLNMAKSNIARANENLRTANLGFHEGVITPTTVMEAQTAWLQAQSQEIDAEIEVRLSQVNLKKALGTLTP